MIIGLKRGMVELAEHNPEWKVLAAQTIERLWGVFGTAAKDIQHVGSTSIRHMKAKPIIDIAVAVEGFETVDKLMPMLNEAGFFKSKLHAVKDDILICDDDEFADTRSYHVHIVKAGSIQWSNYLNFRDYLNANPSIAKNYERIKIISAEKYPADRNAYTNGKDETLVALLGEAQTWACANEILGHGTFDKIEPLNKGLSGDNKLYIETAEGQRFLLRIAEIEEYERKKSEYDMLERAAGLGLPISTPIKFGLCNNGNSVYQLLAWVDGEDLEDVLPTLPETEQYVCGLKAGKLLQKMNTLPAPENAEPWADRFLVKVLRRIEFYETHNLKSVNGELIISYLQKNKRIVQNRPQTFIHGDFNISNLILKPNGEIGAVDFSCYNKDYGDPWWDIFTFIWGTVVPEHFYTGLINGYFNDEPTSEFFKVLSYYLAYDALAALCDTSIGEQGEPQDGQRHMTNVLLWLDNMNNLMPTWYLKDFYIQWVDGVPYKLKEPFDFSFLSKYGKVFKVFDDQDSGNICFGIESDEGKCFLKFAGAPTERASVSREEAIANLNRTEPIYRDLAHANLVKFINTENIGNGFAMIFEWVDAECMHPMYPLSRKKFMQMPVDTKHKVFGDILNFHAHMIRQGYIAIDFYDGSIMYDFMNGRTVICDIDFYTKIPYENNMGRMWGSSRFMSPEEFQLGATIDEITNVYTMGATAFEFFGNNHDRSFEKWTLTKGLYDVALKAVSDERDNRQQSIEQFLAEWSAAK